MRDWNWQDPAAGPEAWRQQFEELQHEILRLLEPLDVDQVNWRPEPGTWSVGECVDHLSRLNAMVLVPLQKAITKGRLAERRGQEPFRYGFVARWFLRSMSPRPTRRVKTPRKYRPAPRHRPETLMVDFARVQMALLETLAEARGLDLGRLRARSPALRLLHLPVGIWFGALAAHEARHLEQARGIRQHPGFPVHP